MRVGLLSTAKISRKTFVAVSAASGCEVVGVASRSMEKARQWSEIQATKCGVPVPKAYTYDELLADPNIDAVYIPLPTGIRKEWVLRVR